MADALNNNALFCGFKRKPVDDICEWQVPSKAPRVFVLPAGMNCSEPVRLRGLIEPNSAALIVRDPSSGAVIGMLAAESQWWISQ